MVLSSTGVSAERPKAISSPIPASIDLDRTIIGNIEIASWVPANDWPTKTDEINEVGVFKTELLVSGNLL